MEAKLSGLFRQNYPDYQAKLSGLCRQNYTDYAGKIILIMQAKLSGLCRQNYPDYAGKIIRIMQAKLAGLCRQNYYTVISFCSCTWVLVFYRMKSFRHYWITGLRTWKVYCTRTYLEITVQYSRLRLRVYNLKICRISLWEMFS